MQCQETTGGAYMEKKTTTLASLPQELLIQILIWLPVKDLIRIKSVCKSWLSLISDSNFANSHFQLSAANPTPRVLYMLTCPPRLSRSIDFHASSLKDDSAYAARNFNLMPFESYPRIEIKGSCRGFLLLHCYKTEQIYDIYLWNPSTGFHKKIPLSSFASDLGNKKPVSRFASSSDKQYYIDCYGFGYDHSTDDYLIVTMSYKNIYDQPQPPPHLEFFSLRANMWKEIEGTQFSYTRPKAGVRPTTTGLLFNGAIHWLFYCHELQANVIVAFDLMEKKLFNLHLPDDLDRKLFTFVLWASGEFLALWVVWVVSDDFRLRLEGWVMKEYKVNSSWTKTLLRPFEHACPICSTKSGDIIADTDVGLVKYNDQGERLESCVYLDGPNGCAVALYIESLLSLPDNEQA